MELSGAAVTNGNALVLNCKTKQYLKLTVWKELGLDNIPCGKIKKSMFSNAGVAR